MQETEQDLRAALDAAPRDGLRHLRLAHMLRASGDDAAAIRSYEAAADHDPAHVDLLLDVGYSLISLGQLDRPEACFRAVRRLAPHGARALAGLGLVARRRGDRAAALALFQASAAADPGNVGVRQEVAAELMALERPLEAEQAYLQLMQVAPGAAGPRLALAQLAEARRDVAAAVSHLHAAIDCEPGNAELRVEAGFGLLRLGQLPAAASCFEAARALAPNAARPLAGLGHVARQMQDDDAAARHFVSAAKLDPDDVDLRLEAGSSLLSLGRLEAAEAHFAAACLLIPVRAGAWLGLAHVARRRGDDTAIALSHIATAVTHGPGDVGVRLDAGYSLLDLRRHDDAERNFVAAAALSPGDPRALAGLAHVAAGRGDQSAASRHFEAALAAEPANFGLRVDAALSLLRLDRIDEAVAHLDAALVQAPDSPRVMAALGQVARQRNDHAAAALRFEEAASHGAGSCDLYLDAGFSRLYVGQFDAAEAHFAEASRLAPGDPRVEAALGHLARGRGDHGGAATHFEIAGRLAPLEAVWKVEFAAEQAKLGKHEAAAQALDLALAQEPGNRGALMARGYLAREAGRRGDALALFRTAFAAHPAFTEAVLAMAEEQRALGRPAEARASLATAMAGEPHNLFALMQQADLCGLAADWPGCLNIAREAIGHHPSRAEPYLEAARALMEMGRLDDAIACLDEGAEAAGPDPYLMVRRAEILRRNGRWEQALLALDAAPLRAGAKFSLWTERMNVLLATGAWDTAQMAASPFPATSAYERALVCHLLGTIAEKRWRLHEAAALNRAALAFRADGGFAHMSLARIAMLLLDMPAALQHQLEASRLEASATILRGNSVRPVQTHVGQMLEEYRMNIGLVDELAKLLPLPPRERVGRLMPIVRSEPGHMAPATQLVIALKQAGMLDRPPGAAWPGRPVPRRIIQYWNDPGPPAEIATLMQGWREAHADWDYLRFDDKTGAAFVAAHCLPAVQLAFRRASEPAQRADIFRLAALKVLGGIYVDADDVCLGRLDAVLPMAASFIGYLEHYGTVANNFLGATAGHPIILDALDMAVAAVNRADEDIIWMSTGPGLLTRSFCQVLCQGDTNLALLAEVCILEAAEHSRVALFHAPAPYKATRRHWLRREFERSSRGDVVEAVIAE